MGLPCMKFPTHMVENEHSIFQIIIGIMNIFTYNELLFFLVIIVIMNIFRTQCMGSVHDNKTYYNNLEKLKVHFQLCLEFSGRETVHTV